MTGPRKIAARRRMADAPAVLVALDAMTDRPLHRQVYDGLRDAILAGRLPAGARLPSTRSLAADLGVARNTVTIAFDQLRAEGYIIGRRGGGTRVRPATPDAMLHVRRSASARVPPATSRAPSGATSPQARLSARGAAFVAAGGGTGLREASPPPPFRLGVPAVDAFPTELWARLTARRWRGGHVHLGEGHAAGDPALRAAIAEYVANARGARCTASQVFVVNGALQALDLVARVLIDRGDDVWVEDPGYIDARVPLTDAGARLVPVPVDGEGLNVTAGERAAPNARLAYVTPSHQFPLGAVMSAPRRLALLSWARRAKAWVFEDDYDSEFRYSGRPLPCLQGLDAERRGPGDEACVLYAGTFSKTLAPGFRLGYLILPDALVDAFRAARRLLDRFAPTLEQGVLADFMGEGHYARHVRRVRTLYAERQETLIAAGTSELDGVLRLAPDAAGLHLVGWLPPGVKDVDAARAAGVEGVEVSPLSRYSLAPPDGSAPGGLLLNYAAFDRRAIRAGARALRRALDGAARPLLDNQSEP
ncbi:MAG: PLP-dependent aminotransferase family protein [Gemmatimonadaceae bacterium]